MRIAEVVLHRLVLPLVRPFRTSFGVETQRDLLLVEVTTHDGVRGWGENVAMSWPGYSPEYVDAAIEVTRRWLLPALFAAGDLHPSDVSQQLSAVVGHPMSKAAVEAAVLDAHLRTIGRSWVDELAADYPGRLRQRIDCGVSVGIPVDDSLPSLLDEVAEYVDTGYRRIKLKIQPGWDHEPVAAVRSRWPNIPLQVDANQAYQRSDIKHLAGLDVFDLLLIEQPLPEDDLVGHARLARATRTPVCLDESIVSLAAAEAALAMGAAQVINIKAGRVGGYLEARRIHDLCLARGVPVWCGGMLETGVGRAANLALAALPGFTLTGDTSGSDRYYRRDITEPFRVENGTMPVPQGPGLGASPLPEILAESAVWRQVIRAEP